LAALRAETTGGTHIAIVQQKPFHARILRPRDRFAFGENWSNFARRLTPGRIEEAERSLRDMLGTDTLSGRSFLDVGCGSGLFSLAAARLGADRIVSFDLDPDCVATTERVRERFDSGDERWRVEEGDVLDEGYMSALGSFDVVYAWGVLHHTGRMETALERTAARVAPGGELFLAVYNDEGRRYTLRWRRIKRTYNGLPAMLRPPFVVATMAPRELAAAFRFLRAGDPRGYIGTWTGYQTRRGMDKWRDLVDWVGGYPFEVARPDRIFDFHRRRGFVLTRLQIRPRGCNQYVFSRPG
jgi:2-polyprenyl-6-hydroxyphenyl methylase/3-demethylubiquinone-9 3-methyltransferase